MKYLVIDPVILDLGIVQIYWYGVMYLLAFLGLYMSLRIKMVKSLSELRKKISVYKIPLIRTYDELTDKEYWTIRKEYIMSSKLNKMIDPNEYVESQFEDRIAILKNLLPIIDLEISQLEKVIIDDTNNLSLLKRTQEIRTERASNSPTLEQIIFSYKSKINGLNAKKSTNNLETNILNNQLKILENVTLQSDELFSLEQERKILENQLQALMDETQVKTLPIGNIEINTIKPKTQLTILLGLIIGFITGILLVFIRNFVKSYRESQA